LFFSLLPPPPPSPPFPYPTLFRSSATGFPFASFTITDGGVLTAVPAVADWLVALFAAIVAAAPAVPVAVNVTGLPDKVPELAVRSEEHTSELQSRFDLVCRLLLEK